MDVTRIKELRDREGMTQKDVAEMIGVSQSTYSTYENGINYLNAERLEKLANMTGSVLARVPSKSKIILLTFLSSSLIDFLSTNLTKKVCHFNSGCCSIEALVASLCASSFNGLLNIFCCDNSKDNWHSSFK